ncbi:MAG: type II secretion system F family protein [Gammaproteobacteria bacterium]|nr:type II secretion system F family protein [Gammaproteobacteria bacterium]
MPMFRYKAINESGVVVSGKAESLSIDALKTKLQQNGLFPQRIYRAHGFTIPRRQKFVSLADLLELSLSLKSLLESGITIPEALLLLIEESQHRDLRQGLNNVLSDVKNGQVLSHCISKHLRLKDAFFVTALSMGENSGNMVASLSHYIAYLRRRIELRKQVTQALAYPIFLVITLVLIVGLLFLFVLPRFVNMYDNFDAELPWITQALMSFVSYLPGIMITFCILTVSVFSFRSYLKHSLWGTKLSLMIEAIPLLGSVLQDSRVERFADSLSTLLASGMSLVASLKRIQAAHQHGVFKQKLLDVIKQVEQGTSLWQASLTTGLLPGSSQKMLQVGESSGNLTRMLSDIAQRHHERLEDRLRVLVSLVEPSIILLMGLLIGIVIVALYLPVFYIMEYVG